MNNNKIFIWSILLMLIPFVMGNISCKKLLDRQPLRATMEDLNQGGLEGQIYGLYGGIRNPDLGGAAWGHIPWLAIHSFRDDDAMKGSSDADGADWAVIYDQYQYSKDHWSTNIYYERKYQMIDVANVILQTADSLKLTDPASLINIGEARFFRALAYFDLVRTYGEVRKVDFPVRNAAQVNSLAKSTVPEIYALIDGDLQYSIQHLPLNWNNAAGISRFPGRLTSGAAKTLYAKALLYRQRWSEALSLCQQIIASGQYALESNYSRIFQDAGENGPESIFEIQAYKGPGGVPDQYSLFATAQGVRGSDASGWNMGWGWNTPTQNLVDSYEQSDPRKRRTILFSGQSDDPQYGGYGRTLPPYPSVLPRPYWNKKVYADPAVQAATNDLHGNGGYNQRILRYADVILMAAEAANETGNGAMAEEYLEMVRARARESQPGVLPKITFQNQLQMRTAIKYERRIEFAMEGERFFDLVRWGDAVTVLGPLGYTHRNRYLPLPQPIIDQSDKVNGVHVLKQNPEYP
ncbi:RagB/SusD family nutrient uptake outer membrane protein [Haoranjiania flava]|uniref:RagB/SusD family nutrient uptake outer membrane protein n=1 Tax=Haoranjiania flava TaxID=1856322 RepID=A0AAE3IMH3_9BACT|nr:RagB/SusD family nutrient uptake outer membrane protein [Haoranjiania flava]MCU7693755.1 RagB/SusD family nutrient uptake outer membrane protein [Haoranjiania flava]